MKPGHLISRIVQLSCWTTLVATCAVGLPGAHAATAAPTNAKPWFCQMGEENEKWDCVQDPELVANPQPTRLPERLPGIEPATPMPVAPGENAPEAVFAPEPAPVPQPAAAAVRAPSPPSPQLSANDTSLPKHMRLAYQPANPVAILDLPGHFWAAQLIALSNKAALERYAEEFNVQGMSAARIAVQGDLFYILLLGIYETRDIANEAISELPPPFDTGTPWIRSVSSLQRAMQAADALAPESPPAG